MKDYLKETRLKKTKQRLAVLDVLQKSRELQSAQSLHEQLAKLCDQVTIYRILETFRKAGFVFEEMREGVKYYYLGKTKHHHITCRKCQKTQCIPCDHVFKSIKGFTQIEHEVTLYGVCAECK